MNPIIVDHLKSAGIVFVGTFLTVLGTSVMTLGIANVSLSLIGGLIISAVTAALKEVFERSVTTSFGGRK